jgi:hypothetical protein
MTGHVKETIISRIDWIRCKTRRALFGVFLTCVRRIPYKVRYWVIMLAWADATQGEWSDQEVPAVTPFQLLERMK